MTRQSDHLPGTSNQSSRDSIRKVSVICLPGSGGQRLVATVRRTRRSGPISVRLVVAADPPGSVVLVVDPLGGALCVLPHSTRDQQALLNQAARHANELWWLLWEMNIDAAILIQQASPIEILTHELQQHRLDTLVLAARNTGRWKPVVAALTAHSERAGVPVHVALDNRPSRLTRWWQNTRP